MSYFLYYTIFFTLYITLLSTITAAAASTIGFSEDISDTQMAKTTHLHFYFHDIVSGKNPSAKKVVGQGQQGLPVFGDLYMIDDVLTEGPELDSKVVGRAQGMYALPTQNDPAFLMVINYEFVEGKYNGSSISILGRNPFMKDVREMPVVGGTGIFRFAKGYALAHTVRFDPTTGDATVEYNVYVQSMTESGIEVSGGLKPQRKNQHSSIILIIIIYYLFTKN